MDRNSGKYRSRDVCDDYENGDDDVNGDDELPTLCNLQSSIRSPKRAIDDDKPKAKTAETM